MFDLDANAEEIKVAVAVKVEPSTAAAAIFLGHADARGHIDKAQVGRGWHGGAQGKAIARQQGGRVGTLPLVGQFEQPQGL